MSQPDEVAVASPAALGESQTQLLEELRLGRIRSSPLPDSSQQIELTAKLYPSEKRIPTGVTTQLDYDLTLGRGIKLPAGAVQTSTGQSYVFTVTGNTTRRQVVTLTSEAGDEVIVRGVTAGTNVIYPVSSDVRDGLRVSVLAEGNQP